MSVQQVSAKQSAKQSNVRKIEPDAVNGVGQDIFSAMLLLAGMDKTNAGMQDNKPADKEAEKQLQTESGDKKIGGEKTGVKKVGEKKVGDKLPVSDSVTTGVSNSDSTPVNPDEIKGDKVRSVHGKIDIRIEGKNEKDGPNIKTPPVSCETAATIQSHSKDTTGHIKNTTAAVEEAHNATLFKDLSLTFNLNKDTVIDNPGSNIMINDNNALVNAVKGTVYTDTNSLSAQPVPKYVDQGNLIQYMSQQIIHASHSGSHTASFRLRPAELGDVRLDISVTDKNVKALIVVENEEVKQMLESSFNHLRDELKNQGLNVEQFKVEINSNGFKDNFKSAYNREEKSGRQWGSLSSGGIGSDKDKLTSIPIAMVSGSRGGISIFA